MHTDVNDIPIEKIKPTLLVSAAPDASLAKLAGLIHDRHIHRIVIVEDEKPTGIVTTSNILKAGKEGKVS
jgi:CBS domain-containing protein